MDRLVGLSCQQEHQPAASDWRLDQWVGRIMLTSLSKRFCKRWLLWKLIHHDLPIILLIAKPWWLNSWTMLKPCWTPSVKPWYSAIPPGNCGHGCRGPRCRCQANCTTCTGGKERRLHDQIMVTLVGYQSEKQLNGILEKGILQSEWLYIYIYIHIYIYIICWDRFWFRLAPPAERLLAFLCHECHMCHRDKEMATLPKHMQPVATRAHGA